MIDPLHVNLGSKLRRVLLIAAAATAGVLALSECSADAGASKDVKGTSMAIATNAGISSYNTNLMTGESTVNSTVSYLTNAWFNYYGSTPNLVENTKFGTEKLVSRSPETVKYTISPGVKWSDGTAVSAADLLLDWASSIQRNNNGTSSIVRNDRRVFLNFASAQAVSGRTFASKATVSSNGRSLTLVYGDPNPDWRTGLPADPLAAHAVYEIAYPGTKPAEANKDVIKAIEGRSTAVLIKIANAWKTAFNFANTPSNKLLDLSDGAYVISSAVKDASIVLVPNNSYEWGPLPKLSKLTFRVIIDPADQIRALQKGEVGLIYGEVGASSANALKKLSNVTTSVSSSSSWDHFDLSEDSGGPFDAASYGGVRSRALLVREAFMKALPRQEMLIRLIRPIQPTATLDDSLTFLPGAAGYDASVASNGSSAYGTVNPAAAKVDLKKAGVSNVDVRVLYPTSNIRNAQEFALIQRSEQKAGFNLINDSSDDWPEILGNQSYDAALFAWQDTTLDAMAGVSHLSILSASPSDFNGFESRTVDLDTNKLVSQFGHPAQLKLLANVDKEGWADASSAPLFQTPDISAWSNNIQNVKDSPLPPGIFWNFWNWTVNKVAN